MTQRLAFRGYAGKKIVFEETAAIPEEDLDKVLPDLAERHAEALANQKMHMIEIEFLDEPDQNQRFFRFGTDPSGMVMPILLPIK